MQQGDDDAIVYMEDGSVDPALPDNEPERLCMLHKMMLLDSPTEDIYDDIVEMGKTMCNVPICLVSIVDANRQWFKAKVGLDASETPRRMSFCGYAILRPGEVFVVEDTHEDPRFKNNPLVKGAPFIRFYAGKPVLDQNGLPMGTVCVIDVKPRKLDRMQLKCLRMLAAFVSRLLATRSLVRQKEEINASLREATLAKSNFLANMSHEIRTPLVCVLGMVELLEDTSLSNLQQEYVSDIKMSGNHLAVVLNDVLDMSKIENAQLDLEAVSFDLQAAVEEVVKLVAPKEGVELLYSFDPNTPKYIVGDSTRLRQIVLNLLTNAIKFTHEGTISLHVRRNERKDAEADDGLTELQFSVSDTGIGVDKKNCDKLFQPFVQANNSTTRKYGGTGLGLSICSSLTNLMKGAMWVKSELNKGSTFHFTIKVPISPTPDKQLVEPTPKPGTRVLVMVNSKLEDTFITHLRPKFEVTVVPADSADAWVQEQKEASSPLFFNHFIVEASFVEAIGLNWLKRTFILLKQPTLFVLDFPSKQYQSKLQSLDIPTAKLCYVRKPVVFSSLIAQMAEADHTVAAKGGSKKRRGKKSQLSLAEVYPLRLLVVDDNKINLKVIKRLLASFGFEAPLVHSATNGSEAVRKVVDEGMDFDLVLMDCQMPVMDGFVATKLLKEFFSKHSSSTSTHSFNPVRTEPVIVAMTASVFKEDLERCRHVGMSDILPKPYSRAKLKQAITKLGQTLFGNKHLPDSKEREKERR